MSAGERELGLVLDIGGYYKNVITLVPSLEITSEEIDLAAILLEQVLVRALESLADWSARLALRHERY